MRTLSQDRKCLASSWLLVERHVAPWITLFFFLESASWVIGQEARFLATREMHDPVSFFSFPRL